MGAVKSKQKRVRARSSTFSSGYSSYNNNNYNYNNNNPILHHSRSEPTTPHYEPIHYTNINDNLINIVNIINNLNTQQQNNNNNTTENTTSSSSSNNNNSEDKNATGNNENHNNNKVRRKKHTIRDSFGDEILLFDFNSIILDKDDQFSRSTSHVIWRILALLSMRELCNVQQVSHFWYIAGKENEIWKSIILRDSHIWESTSRGLINTLKIGHTPVKWKKIAKEECSLVECWKCKRKFQKCKNSSVACMYHPQGRELIEDKIGAPSGVYWTCCLNKSRVSPGCVIGYHSEYDWSKDNKEKGKKKDNNNNNNNRVRVPMPPGLRGWRVSL